MRRTVLTILTLVLLSLPVPVRAQSSTQVVGAVPADPGLRQQTFDMVWRTVKDKHWDPQFGGVDWDRVRTQYEPRALGAKSEREFYQVLQRMLGELRQSHFGIIPPEAAPAAADNSDEPKGGTIGIDIRFIDNQAVIWRVEPNSPGQRAGLRPGFVISAIGETTVKQLVDRFKLSTESPAITRTRITRTVLAFVNGEPGTRVRLTILDEKDQSRQITTDRVRLRGEMSQPLGNFPPQYTEFEARRLQAGIGYIRFNVFVMLLMDRIRNTIREMRDAPGIIIDLRGNPGGVGGMAAGIAGVLQTKEASLGEMRYRVGYNRFAIFPQPNPYLGPVVVLTDGGSASTSEIFAAGLQELGRATVIGERTMGAALPSVFTKLPTGALFQYAIADFKTPKGKVVEGNGVTPDIEVKLTRNVLLADRDPQLDAAIQRITRK